MRCTFVDLSVNAVRSKDGQSHRSKVQDIRLRQRHCELVRAFDPEQIFCSALLLHRSFATEYVTNKTLDEVLRKLVFFVCLTFVWQINKVKNTDIAGHLNLPPVKLHCSSAFACYRVLLVSQRVRSRWTVLAEDAIKAAAKDYLQKKQSRVASASA